jgi:alkylation response protein AidB-like acyl-CoA dehydrogenase
MTYDLRLSPEQIEIRDTVRDFVNGEIKPMALNAERLDKGDRSLAPELLRKASRLGLRTLSLPEDMGGAGADALTSCIVTEELAAGDPDIAAVLGETSTLGRLLFAAMTPQQRERFLPAFLDDDDYHLALADHEPGSETSLGANYRRPSVAARKIATMAVRDGGDWIVNGAKDCVSNAPLAKLFAVEARSDSGNGLLLVPPDAPGLAITEQPEPRWYHGSCGNIVLRDCRVPADNWLPAERPDPGRENPWRSARNLGIGRAAYEAALEYAGLRVQGGRPIAEHQAIGTKLADIAIRLDAARGTVWRAAFAADHPEATADRSLPDLPLSVIARIVTSEAVYRAAKDAAECFGAMGVMRDMPMQKYIHDARICLFSGDGNADLRLRVAEALASYRRGPSMLAAE